MSFLQAVKNYKYKNLTFFIIVTVLVILILISVKPTIVNNQDTNSGDNSKIELDIDHLIAENSKNEAGTPAEKPVALPKNTDGDSTPPETNNNANTINQTEATPPKTVVEESSISYKSYTLQSKQTVITLFKSLGISNKEFYAIYNSTNGKILDRVNAKNPIYIAYVGNTKQVKALKYGNHIFILNNDGKFTYQEIK